jgi:hypothetical protein
MSIEWSTQRPKRNINFISLRSPKRAKGEADEAALLPFPSFHFLLSSALALVELFFILISVATMMNIAAVCALPFGNRDKKKR